MGRGLAAERVAHCAELVGGTFVGIGQLSQVVFDLGDLGAKGFELGAQGVEVAGVSSDG